MYVEAENDWIRLIYLFDMMLFNLIYHLVAAPVLFH